MRLLAAPPREGARGMHVGEMGVLSRYLTVGAGAVLTVLWVAGCANGVAARVFRAADIQEESYPTVQALLYMDKLVAERTGGRHRIQVFHSRQLGEESQTIEQTRVGAIDLNRINVAAIGDVAPVLSILAQPFLFRSIDHLYKVIDGPIGDDILAAIEPNGFIGLTFYDSGARSIYTRAPPVHGLADLKGLRIRVQQSDLVIRMMKALGAEPVAMPYGQVMTALSAQLVDGAENNWPSFVTTGHYRVAQFYAVTEHTMGPEVLVMSRRAWQELSEADRAIFRAAARDSSRHMREQWLSWEEESKKQAAEAGVTVIDHLDRKPFEDATRSLRDEMRADPRFGPLIGRIQAVQ
jgi:tripartite ATP-independent transporter DctP family solute receptor